MTRFTPVAAGAFAACASLFLAAAAPPGHGSADPVVATVNGEPIPLSRLNGGSGAGLAPGETGNVLDRMISVELVIQEGYRMGLDATLEVKDQLGIFERDTLRDGLFASRVGNLKPDPKQVEWMAKAMTLEVRFHTAHFAAKADADLLVARAAKGDDFDAAASEIAAGGKGGVELADTIIRMSNLLPEVQAALDVLSPREVSSVYKVKEWFVVSKLFERSATPDPDARVKAEAEVLRRSQLEAVTKYTGELRKKYAKVDEPLYATLDFDAEQPGFESYLEDRRTLVTIASAEPILVRELAGAVRKRLFHGAGRAAEKGRLNRKKDEVLDDLIAKRVIMREARAKGLDKKPEYLALRSEVERKLVFGAFVAKVIEPEVKVADDEIGSYYASHIKDFTAPDMARLESLAFRSRGDAEAALAKLRAGADLAWMRTNAPGRVGPEANPNLLVFPAAPVMLADLPDPLRQSLAKAESGEYRLHTTPDGTTYVIQVREILPGKPLTQEAAAGQIRAKLTGEKRQRAFDGYVATLRKASDVKILVTPEEIEKLLGSQPKA